MLLLAVGWPTSVTAVVRAAGHRFLFGAERIVGDRVGTGRGELGAERRAGRQDVEFGGLLVAPDLRRCRAAGAGAAISGRSDGPAAVALKVSVTE